MYSTENKTGIGLSLPNFVVFEGVDGVGKSTFEIALVRYYKELAPDAPLFYDSFPGTIKGTLGELVYRFHHGEPLDGIQFTDLAHPALQLLHVTSHIDTIVNRIKPVLDTGGNAILGRSHWSTYAYGRLSLTQGQALALIHPEEEFQKLLPPPTVLYMTREKSLKSDEVNEKRHRILDQYYREIIEKDRMAGKIVHEISNDGKPEETWNKLLDALRLPIRPLSHYTSVPQKKIYISIKV